jgi:hypothetical protein
MDSRTDVAAHRSLFQGFVTTTPDHMETADPQLQPPLCSPRKSIEELSESQFVGKEGTILTRLNRLLFVILLLATVGTVLGITLGHKSRSSAKPAGPANPNEVLMQAVRQGNLYRGHLSTSTSETEQSIVRTKSLSPLQQCGVEDDWTKLEELMETMVENTEIRNKLLKKLSALSLRGVH